MNNSTMRYAETQLDLREMLFRLLSQWKAVFLVALLMAVMVSGLKYMKDVSGIRSQEASAVETLTQDEADAKAEEVLSRLGGDRGLVDLVLQQEKWLGEEYAYLNDSILMNIDPANVRAIDFNYYISGDNDDAAKIAQAYRAILSGANFVQGLGKHIDADAEQKFVKELISFIDDYYIQAPIVSADPSLYFRIIIPSDCDANAVISYTDSFLKQAHDDITGKATQHKLTQITADESYSFDQNLFTRKTTLVTNAYNIQNALKTNKNALNDAQKSAYNEVKSIYARVATDSDMSGSAAGADGSAGDAEGGVSEVDTAKAKPGISKKYAMLGFVLGAMLYAMAYVVIMLLQNRVRSASDAEAYTGVRTLGEIYSKGDHGGLKALLHSGLVERALYKGLGETDKAAERIANSLSAVCSSKNAKGVKIFDLSAGGDLNEKRLEELKKRISKTGIKASIADMSGEIDEAALVGTDNAVFYVSADETGAMKLIQFTELCREYAVDCLGTIYSQMI